MKYPAADEDLYGYVLFPCVRRNRIDRGSAKYWGDCEFCFTSLGYAEDDRLNLPGNYGYLL